MTADETAIYRCPHCGFGHADKIQQGPEAACLSRWVCRPCLDAGKPATMVPTTVMDAAGWRPVRPGEWTKRDGWALLDSGVKP